ncbi:hypothetical protein NEOLEDRAFT_1131648 [Neolentinus lepideus HHB14362 ss-1]|uniref:Uncharacterized protein n=1 Tax=Neolentinus lepideus HHB14362 ss-1 TaxID=1314782 RepID=A0A165TH60_9AGAM|nr:hypothetical protein NEOLEDRAFT_1131648 [Neolentinus lepideus HHB14362 ss-1]
MPSFQVQMDVVGQCWNVSADDFSQCCQLTRTWIDVYTAIPAKAHWMLGTEIRLRSNQRPLQQMTKTLLAHMQAVLDLVVHSPMDQAGDLEVCANGVERL